MHYSSPDARLYTCYCWTSSGSSLLNSLVCPGLVEQQHSLLLCQILLTAFHDSKLSVGVIYHFIQVIDEDTEQDWPQHQPLGPTSSYRPPTRLCATDHNPLSSTSQPALSPPTLPLFSKLTYNDVMGNCQKPCWSPGTQHPLLSPHLPSWSWHHRRISV